MIEFQFDIGTGKVFDGFKLFNLKLFRHYSIVVFIVYEQNFI